MFVVTDVRRRLLFWTSVTLKAEADLSLTDDRAKWDKVGAPMLKKRRIDVKQGETITILAFRPGSYELGDLVPLDRIAGKHPLSRKWRVIATA
jgi:hypothetical protein